MKDRGSLLLTNVILFCVFGLLPLGLTPHPLRPERPAPPTAAPVVTAGPIGTELADYLWPTDAGTVVTSTFGEYRSSHFHAGVDISTGDRNGHKVFASRDGYVSFISINPSGYGKMLEVRHPDGYTTLYAHLDGYAGTIEERARQEQERLERFAVDIACEPGELPVHKGDVIAYTGDTGAGTAHLHFEIRDTRMDGINPLLGWADLVDDSMAPTIGRIAVSPLDEFSRVQGGWRSQVYVAHETGRNVYRVRQTIPITGRAGFAINARDRNEHTSFTQGVYSYQLLLDDHLISSVVMNRAPAVEIQRIGQYYDWELLDEGQGRFERLYADSAAILPFFAPPVAGTGVINSETFPEGPHTFRIVCQDIAGNTSEVTGNLVFNHPPSFNVTPGKGVLNLSFDDIGKVQWIHYATKRNASNSWITTAIAPQAVPGTAALQIPLPANADVVRIVAENAYGTKSRPQFVYLRKPVGTGKTLTLEQEVHPDYVRLLLKTDGAFTEAPTVTVTEGNAVQTVPMTAVETDLYEGSFRPLPAVAGTRRITAEAEVHSQRLSTVSLLDLFPVVPGTKGKYTFDDGNLVVSYDSTSVYETVFLQVEKTVEDGQTLYRLQPGRTVLRDGLRVRLRVGSQEVPQGLYFRGRGSFNLIAQQKNPAEPTLEGKISRTLGDLTLLPDVQGPLVTRLSIPRTRQPNIRFSFGDKLSGIEYRELKTYIDGQSLIPEIDGEHRRAFIRIAEPLDRGSHRLTIRLKDRAGNTSVVERRFSVR